MTVMGEAPRLSLAAGSGSDFAFFRRADDCLLEVLFSLFFADIQERQITEIHRAVFR